MEPGGFFAQLEHHYMTLSDHGALLTSFEVISWFILIELKLLYEQGELEQGWDEQLNY